MQGHIAQNFFVQLELQSISIVINTARWGKWFADC